MAIKITENGNVNYINENDVNRNLFPNEITASKLLPLIEELERTKVKTKRVTVTTGSNGAFNMNMPTNKYQILAVEPIDNDGKWFGVVAKTTGSYYGVIKLIATNANVASTEMQVDIAYIEV